jgi:hypothetical protein
MPMIERFCDRALMIEDSQITAIGKPVEIAAMYENLFIDDQNKKQNQAQLKPDTFINVDVGVEISQGGKRANAVKSQKPFTIDIFLKPKKTFGDVNIGINIRNDEDKVVFSTDIRNNVGLINLRADNAIELSFSIDNWYTNGSYYVDMHLVKESVPSKVLYKSHKCAEFSVRGVTNHSHSLFHPLFDVQLKKK